MVTPTLVSPPALHLSFLLLLLLLLSLLSPVQARGGGGGGGEKGGRLVGVWKEDVNLSLPQTQSLPLCKERGGADPPCFHPAPQPMGWGSAHKYCRGLGGYLAGWGESEGLGGVWSDPSPLTWTSLTPHHGHYQWLSQCPGGSELVRWQTSAPHLWDRDCAAYDVTTREFRLHPCNATMPFLCHLHQHHQHQQHLDLSDVELVVEGNEVPGPYGWYNLSRRQFKDLTLTCRAYSRTTGRPLLVQPPRVFWSKDHVYTGQCEGSLMPATVHDATKSESEVMVVAGVSERQSEFPSTNQGTYWCEAWNNRSTVRLQSNKVLITLQDTVVLIFKAHMNESQNATLKEVEHSLRSEFVRSFRNIYNRTLAPVAVSKEKVDGSKSGVVKYTFHLHVLKKDLNFQKMKNFNHKKYTYDGHYSDAGFLPTSTVFFPYFCLTQSKSFDTDRNLKWPFSFAGNVHPTNHRCKVKYGKLKPGHCVWDYTNGAHLTFDPSGCGWTDLCPKGYTMLSNRYCMTISDPGPWGTGFNNAYKTGQEMTIVDYFHSQRSGKDVAIHDLVRDQTGSDLVWLPVRRVRKFAPLNHIDPWNSGPIEYNESENFNITWADGQPNGAQACLALDLAKKHLLTSDCHSHYPFVSITKATFLKRPLSHPSISLVINNSLCDSGWQSTQLTENLFCFKLFEFSQNLTWQEANAYCGTQNATLPSPNVGFLDWVYRKYLYNKSVPDVWMGARWRPDRILYNDSVDHLNWLADTDYTKEYGVLNQEGWILVDENTTKTQVLCQQRRTPETALHMELLKPEYEASQTMCIRAKPRYLLSETEDSNLQCFINGVYRSHNTQDSLNCPFELTVGNQGYYECYAWSRSPVELVQSNTILHEDHGTFTFIISLLHNNDYNPEEHDSTFMGIKSSHTCSDVLMYYLRSDTQVREFRFTMQNFLYKPRRDSKLLENFHLKCKLKEIDSNYTEGKVLNTLRELLHAGVKHSNCSLEKIRSTTGCQREVTWNYGYNTGNLTWPKTTRTAVVIPEELCVTPEGEAVTRECLGDFMLGYFWKEAGNCTGRPTNVTRELWKIKNNPKSYLTRPFTNAITPALLPNLTSNSQALQPIDIHLIAKTFESFTHYNISSLDLDEIVEILNNVMGANSSTFAAAQTKLNSSGTLLEAFEELTFKVELGHGDEPKISAKELISVERLDVQANSTIVGYKSSKVGKGRQKQSLLKEGVTLEDLSDAGAAIVLPRDLTFNLTSKPSREGRSRGLVSEDELKLPLTFAVYRNDKLFQDRSITNTSLVNTWIIQATFKGRVVKNLSHPVKIYFTPLRRGNGSRCVFWDFAKNDRRGGWSEDGCRKVEEGTGDQVVCYCNHLTSFAHLINYNEDSGIEGIHEVILDIITIIGCCLSILSLLLVFTTFFLFKKWRRSLSNKILVNLSFSVFCSVVIFVSGIDQTWNITLCRTVAVALHYFILASFGWMLVEGVHQYLKFVKVVGTYIPRFLWKASVCAWGIPILPVLVLLIYNPSIYDSRSDDELTICWMSPQGFKIAFLPPLVITMAANLAIFSMIIHGAVCGRARVNSTVSERNLFMNQLRMSICVFFLLGFTWIFGMLAVSEGRLVFSYLFCIFNTLQGFFLFLFHVLRERTARKYWKDFLSILTQEPVSSTPGNSMNAPNSGQMRQDSVTFEKCGGILVLPQGPHAAQYRRTARTSLLSARTLSTAPSSRGSFSP